MISLLCSIRKSPSVGCLVERCYLSVNSQLYLTQCNFSIITTGRDVFFFLKRQVYVYGNAEGEVVNANVPSERITTSDDVYLCTELKKRVTKTIPIQ